MTVYQYSAVDRQRGKVTGTVTADTPRSARDQIRSRGLVVQRLEPSREKSSPGWLEYWLDKRQEPKLVDFVSELATLLAVGIPLIEALDTTTRSYRGRFKTAILELREQVAGGRGLAEAMADRPALFDDLTVNLVETGENAGTLDSSLERLADFKQRFAQLKGRIGTALIYPGIILTLAIGVTLFLMTYVVPRLLTSLEQAGTEVPATTAIVKGISDFLLAYWWLLITGGVLLVGAAALALSHPALRYQWHRFQLKIPILGNILRKQGISRIAIVLGTLLKSGIPFIQALRIARRTSPNLVIRQALEDCERAVTAGGDIAPALERTAVFPPTVLQIFAVGQQSGRLETMLERLAADYDRQVELAAQRLTAALEPLLIILMVVIVGFIAFATVLPMLEAGNVLQ